MAKGNANHVEVIDIHQEKPDQSLLTLTLECLQPRDGGPRRLPTLLLYDELGLRLFEDITYLKEYYPTNAEIEVLQTHCDKIVEYIPEGAQLVELGSGNLRKVDILLRAFEKAQKAVHYFALDLSLPELERTFSEISSDQYRYVRLTALHGTYDDGLAWLQKQENRKTPTCVLSLGSSIGNFTRTGAASFLAGFAEVLGLSDHLVIGLDSCQDPQKVYRAYNDSDNVTHRFYRNGLDHANKLLGYDAFKQGEWEIVGVYDEKLDRHEASYRALVDVSFENIDFRRGEQLKLEEAHKYSKEQAKALWHSAGLIEQAKFSNTADDYNVYLLSPSRVQFSRRPEKYAGKPVPTLKEWERLWCAWDTATKGIIPQEELLAKPIQLRNALIFYLGHIPTFADMHMTAATTGKSTEPSYYPSIFERGIDPDVDNPELCHKHSEIPDSWPPLEEILSFSARVRQRVRAAILAQRANGDRRLGRALWLVFEHEVLHLETFLYMLLQSDRILPPPGASAPDFSRMAIEAAQHAVPNEWFHIPATSLTLGIDDPENDVGPDRYFGWDNERPPRLSEVHAFEAKARPITNGEYARYLEKNALVAVPASWSLEPSSTEQKKRILCSSTKSLDLATDVSADFLGNKYVRTPHGLVPLGYSLDWPVMASYDELAACAKWMNGRIPTLEEARSIYNFVKASKKLKAENIPSTLISAVNGHLSNDGVEETPPQKAYSQTFSNGDIVKPNPHENFVNLEGCNVGFKHWHPVPVTQNGNKLCGQGDFGGAWEWTSSSLEKFEGFKAMDLYPAYTGLNNVSVSLSMTNTLAVDFFDGKHNIVLGGSWATHPRIAGRTSLWARTCAPNQWTFR
ncbi:MAG: hypothetical protein Q9160_003086 [Pyrenula sp. 1 TL-2023]